MESFAYQIATIMGVTSDFFKAVCEKAGDGTEYTFKEPHRCANLIRNDNGTYINPLIRKVSIKDRNVYFTTVDEFEFHMYTLYPIYIGYIADHIDAETEHKYNTQPSKS